jgi:hypothetical protein
MTHWMGTEHASKVNLVIIDLYLGMKLVLAIFICISANSLYSQFICNHPENISWGSFQGKKDAKLPFVAYTYTNLTLQYNISEGTITLGAVACFNTYLSWVDSSKLMMMPSFAKDSLLVHERLHFYNAVILAKKFALTAKNCSPLEKARSDSLIHYYTMQLKKVDSTYDADTRHGADLLNQQKWEETTYAELAALKNIQLGVWQMPRKGN